MTILLPHGGYPLIAATLSTMAWITALSHDGCDFVRLTGPSAYTLTAPEEYPFIELGFRSYRVPVLYEDYNEWQIRYSDACRPYDVIRGEENDNSFDFDIWWRIGSTTHYIGLVLGGAACMFLWVSSTCLAITKLNWRLLGIQLFLASFFHLSSFLWFFNGLCYTEGTECHWFYGSNSLIGAIALYFFSCVTIFVKYPESTVVKLMRTKVVEDFQRYEYTEATVPPSDFDETSGIHSLYSHQSQRSMGTHGQTSVGSGRAGRHQQSQRSLGSHGRAGLQRSQRDFVV